MVRYADFLKKGGTIGTVAPSFGCNEGAYLARYNQAKKFFIDNGFNIKEANSVNLLDRAQSNTPEIRAKEFMDMYLDETVDIVFSVAGGEIMIEILPYIDFDVLANAKPKYFIGFSDNTNLTFLLTTICDVASFYASNFVGFGLRELHQSIMNQYEILQGNIVTQESFDKYASSKEDEEDFLAPLVMDADANWVNARDEEEIVLKGRIIGGCLDCINMLVGTPFDKVASFIEKYKDDNIIWFLESCDLTVLSFRRYLWQLKQAGWFKNAKGFVFGRPLMGEAMFDVTFKDSALAILGDLDVPIILDACFGHIPPKFTLITGSCVEITSKNKKGIIKTYLK